MPRRERSILPMTARPSTTNLRQPLHPLPAGSRSGGVKVSSDLLGLPEDRAAQQEGEHQQNDARDPSASAEPAR